MEGGRSREQRQTVGDDHHHYLGHPADGYYSGIVFLNQSIAGWMHAEFPLTCIYWIGE